MLVDGIFEVSVGRTDNFLFLICTLCTFKFYVIENLKDNFKKEIIFNVTSNKQKVLPTQTVNSN